MEEESEEEDEDDHDDGHTFPETISFGFIDQGLSIH